MTKTTKEIMEIMNQDLSKVYPYPYFKKVRENMENDVWFSQSEFEQLRQELKDKVDCMSFGITGTKFNDDLCYVSEVLKVIDAVFAKYIKED